MKMKSMFKVTSSVVCSVVFSTATAQTTLEEIVVTAQKREESLQDIPVSVKAFSANEAENLGVESVVDIKIVAPSLNSVAANGIYIANTIRGVGSLGIGAGVESPVGIYIDGVYQAAPFLFSTQLNNISSVEVLNGPQGTLFGRNATGGLVHIKTARPPSDPAGKFSLSYGNERTRIGKAYFGGAVLDDLSADVAFSGKWQGDGFGTNLTTGEDWNRQEKNRTARTKWLWTPSEQTEVTLLGSYFEGKGTMGAAVGWPGKVSGFPPFDVSPDLGFDSEGDHPFTRQIDGGGGSLQVRHDFERMSLTSITAYQESYYELEQDLDATPFPLAFLTYSQDDDQFSQEFQLSSSEESRLSWIVGLFYFDAQASADFIANFANLGGFFVDGGGVASTKSAAIYGQGTYALTNATSLTLGVRYTDEKREELDAVTDFIFNPSFPSPGPNITIPGTFPDSKLSEEKVTWRVALDYQVANDFMVYASISTGFKSGGFNTTTLPGAEAYLSEELTSYEFGFKSEMLENTLRLNIAAFYNDYQDVQIQGLSENVGLLVFNGPGAEIYGVDGDFTAILSDTLRFSGGFSWLDTDVEKFTNCPVSDPAGGVPLVVGDCTGNSLPFASELTFSSALTYFAEVGKGSLEATVNIYYNDGYYFEVDNVLEQGSYVLWGGRVNYTFRNGFSVGVYGKNLSDERIAGYGLTQTNGSAAIAYLEPRTYGVTVGYEF